MNDEKRRKRVNDIYAAIDGLNEKLRELRETCPHTSTEIQDYTWGPGRYSKAIVCDHCDEHLGNPEMDAMNAEFIDNTKGDIETNDNEDSAE